MREGGVFARMIGWVWKEQQVPEDRQGPGKQEIRGKENDLKDLLKRMSE